MKTFFTYFVAALTLLATGSVLAAEIFLPRYMHAAVAVHNPLEIR